MNNPMAANGVPMNVTPSNPLVMERYKNWGGNSGVFAFTNGADYIVVQFIKGGTYRYSYRSAGRENIEQMKALAAQGQGLGTFINKYVRNAYESKTS